MSSNDPTLSRVNLEMVTIADEFCKLTEGYDKIDAATFIKTLRGFIPLLYLRGSLLQAAEPEFPEANERFVTEEQWDDLFTGLRALLGTQDEFQYMGLSEYGEQTVLRGSLSEHIADVYQDLKDFVLLFKRPAVAARENAVFECARLFSERWGNRLATMMPVVHQLSTEARPGSRDDDFQDLF